MNRILRIDASARQQGSKSRELGDHFQTLTLQANPSAEFLRKDLAETPIPQIVNETIVGFYSPHEAMTDETRNAVALSDRLIGELQSADTLLITTPMYNLGIPAALKAWIDQIVRINVTFAFDGAGFAGLAKPKQAVVCVAYGSAGYEPGGAMNAGNFVEPYMEFLLKFIGIETVHFIRVQGTAAGDESVDDGMVAARAEIDALLPVLAG